MAKQRTLAIIKPDAVQAKSAGKILARIEKEGFQIVALKMIHLSKREAGQFYAVHRERPFFGELTDFMASGPVVVMSLEADDAIPKWRDLMGATDSKEAAEGTLRALFGTDKQNNATHGSDAVETSAEETKFFFPEIDLVNSTK